MTSLSAAVPTISLSLKGRALSEAILDACTGTGFFYLTDIPIESRLIDTAWKASEQLFLDRSEAAMAQKMKTRSRETNTGYTALLEEKLDPEGEAVGGAAGAASSSSSPDAKHDGKAEEEDGLKKTTDLPGGDMKESFYIARLKEKETRLQTLPPLFDEYNDDLTELFEACKETTTIVMRAFAVALGLQEEYFASQHHAIDDRLRLIHYPPITSQDEGKGYIRAGSHSDYGTITLLFQRGVSGLQVQVDSPDGKKKQWIDVEPKKNAIVVNVGDALEFWTAGAFRSTQHRVVMPRNEGEAVSRFSIAYFCQPDPDAMLDPLSNINAIKPFPPREEKDFQEVLRRKGIDSSVQRLTGGQHLQQRLSSTYVN